MKAGMVNEEYGGGWPRNEKQRRTTLEQSRNVPWNQQLGELHAHRGLLGTESGRPQAGDGWRIRCAFWSPRRLCDL